MPPGSAKTATCPCGHDLSARPHLMYSALTSHDPKRPTFLTHTPSLSRWVFRAAEGDRGLQLKTAQYRSRKVTLSAGHPAGRQGKLNRKAGSARCSRRAGDKA